MLKSIENRVKKTDNVYNLIFLLINSLPKKEDIQKCQVILENMAYCPISIIIIGIGDKDFKDLRNLISFQRNGLRDNISFCSMKECNFNNEILQNKCLRSIPSQFTEYFHTKKETPNRIRTKIFGDEVGPPVSSSSINNSGNQMYATPEDDDIFFILGYNPYEKVIEENQPNACSNPEEKENK